MRASLALVVLVAIASSATYASALNQTGYAVGSAENYTSKVAAMAFAGSVVCEPNGALNASSEAGEADNDTESGYCEIGVGGNTTGAYPLWILIPAFSGTSIFGINSLGASASGLPVFKNTVIGVECGAGGTVGSCPDHPEYSYSPMWVAVQHSIGIYNGIFNLPEGVMPVPGHTHANEDSYLGPSGRWYIIPVFVLDPNIMPNATTGTCQQLIPSNLSNATGNCLDSYSDIFRAMNTTTTAVTDSNGGNPIWYMFNHTTYEAVVPGLTPHLQIVDPTTNRNITFTENQLSYYVGEPLNISAINLPGQSNRQPGSSSMTTWLAVAAICAIIAAGAIAALERRLRRPPEGHPLPG